MKYIYIFLGVFVSLFSQAQFATLSAGGEGSGPGGTVSFSIGQLVVEETEDSEGSISPGVQQTYESSVVYVSETVSDNRLMVYPNPTNHFVQLQFEKTFVGRVRVLDVNGRLVFEESINDLQKNINAQSWPSGIYLLHVLNGQNVFSIHKVVKNG